MRRLLRFENAKRDAQIHFRDILEAIGLIEQFIGTMNFDSYRSDLKTKSAVERQMQIITEAAVRLGEDAERLCPGIDWAGYRGMGNLLRHAYHRIEDQLVWNTIQDELPAMRQAVLAVLRADA